MKPIVHHLRSNTEIGFDHDPESKLYSIHSGTVVYQMPYVLTLRLRRYLKGTTSPTPQQLIAWYEALPTQEKAFVRRSTLY